MNHKIWNGMSNSEKYAYLMKHQPLVSHTTGISTGSKVGNDNCVITVHIVTRGKVQTSGSFECASAAILHDKEVMRNWAEAAQPEKE